MTYNKKQCMYCNKLHENFDEEFCSEDCFDGYNDEQAEISVGI